MTNPTDGNAAAPGDIEPPARDNVHGTELRTFLIADVRGYTKYTAEFGDEAAGRLATRFAELVEEVVATRDGFLLELRGDEALVVFVSARQALRAAVELQERFLTAGLPRGVGIGLDAGEAVPVGDGFRGSALNLAARLCAQAGPGEIIASEAVIHLAARLDGISYVEPRSFRLKGLTEPIRAVGVVASSRVPHGIRRRVRRARQLGAERKVLGAGVVAGLVLITGALALSGAFVAKPGPSALASPDTTSPVVVASAGPATGPGVAFLDAASGNVTALNATLRRPIDAQWVGSNLWVYDADPAAFHRIDPSSGSINRSISTTIAVGRWLVDGNAIWVTDRERPTLHRIDIQSGRETDAFPLSSDSTDTRSSGGIVKVAGSLWIALFGPSTSSVVRVDPQSGSIAATVDDVYVTELAATDNRIWGSAPWGEMTPIDPETSTAGPATGIPGPIQSVVVMGNDAWATNRENGAVYQVQPGRDIAISHFGFPGATSISSSDGKLWVGGGQTATALDAGSGRTMSYPIGHAVSDVEAAGGTVAVLSAKGIEDALAGLSGSVLKIASAGNPYDVIDPAIRRDVGSEERDQIDQATCARLLNYPDKPAPEGSQLEPEVAESMPIVSPDGLTYTFQVRPGYAFSPPSSEPITADTFRATIERALDPRLGPNSEGIDLLGDIVGAQDFHSQKSGTVSGISVAGNALTITLRAPSSSFLRRLALPTFCPVPIGTARVLGGVNDPPLPGSGAMYVADRVNGQYFILKRNPNYGGTRKPGFETIAWLLGVDSADAISRLEAGTIDVVPSADQLAPGGPIDRAWGPGSNNARAGDQRYFVSDGRVTALLALKSSDVLLRDPDVRRAIALVVDRNAMAGAFDFLPTSGMRSHEMTGAARDEPFILAGGSVQALDAARALMRGRTGATVISFPSDCAECQRMTGRIASDLRSIGIGLTVEYQNDSQAAAERPGSEISVLLDFVWQPYPEDAAIVETVRQSIPKGWLGSEVEASIEGLNRLTGSARVASSAAVLDRLEGQEARIIPFGAVWDAAYVGPNVGCAIFAPGAPHLDLVALCPKGP